MWKFQNSTKLILFRFSSACSMALTRVADHCAWKKWTADNPHMLEGDLIAVQLSNIMQIVKFRWVNSKARVTEILHYSTVSVLTEPFNIFVRRFPSVNNKLSWSSSYELRVEFLNLGWKDNFKYKSIKVVYFPRIPEALCSLFCNSLTFKCHIMIQEMKRNMFYVVNIL